MMWNFAESKERRSVVRENVEVEERPQQGFVSSSLLGIDFYQFD